MTVYDSLAIDLTSLISSVISTFYGLSTKRIWKLATAESHEKIGRITLTTGDGGCLKIQHP